MSRPRILFFMPSASPIGGVETWLDRLCTRLADTGFDPLVALVRGQVTQRAGWFRKYHANLPVIEVDGRGMDCEGRVRAAARCIRSTRPAAVLPLGVLDAHDAAIRRKLAGQPVRLIGCAHMNLPPMFEDLRAYREWFDLVVCPGRLTARFLVQNARFAEDRVRHVPNGADPPRVPHVDADSSMPLRLGYVGRFSQGDKRVLDAVQLCERLDEMSVSYTLDMVGDGPARPQVEAQLPAAGRRVRFHGALSHDEVYSRILPNLDVSLLFSASEAFGISIVEAMMNGVVPVTSEYLGFHSEQLVLDGRTGLSFPVGDMPAAARAIQSLAADRRLLRRLAAAGRSHAGQHYPWERSLVRWVQTLESALSRPPLLGREQRVARRMAGRLDTWGVPSGLTDLLRRSRIWIAGPATAPGGEEWPLFGRHYDPLTLGWIAARLSHLDRAAAVEVQPPLSSTRGD